MPGRDTQGATPARLLFLCGYQTPTRHALRDVLYRRGLIDVLHAGDTFASMGARLTVAIPFLRDAGMRDELSKLAGRLCANFDVALVGAGSPLDLLAQHDVFLFPYRVADAVFVPTSLLEAAQIGIPILAADQVCYRSLTAGDAAAACRLHRPGDAHDLSQRFAQLAQGYVAIAAAAKVSAERVRTRWTLAGAADALLAGVTSVNPPVHARR